MTEPVFPIIRNAGVDGKLVSFAATLSEPANRAAIAFRAALGQANWPGVLETSSSLVSAYLRFDLSVTSHAKIQKSLHKLLETQDWYASDLPKKRKLWRIPAVFDVALTPQLAEAAEMSGQSVKDAVSSLCDTQLRVYNIGFAPGQPYLGTLSEAWNLPRQTALTPQVPVGAITVALRQIVMFSVTSPTGWRHMNPFALSPGDEVIYTPVSAQTLHTLRADPDGGATAVDLP